MKPASAPSAKVPQLVEYAVRVSWSPRSTQPVADALQTSAGTVGPLPAVLAQRLEVGALRQFEPAHPEELVSGFLNVTIPIAERGGWVKYVAIDISTAGGIMEEFFRETA